jgi:hypothetical protein
VLNSYLIGIRRCKVRGADVVRSSQGAPEADITLNLEIGSPLMGVLQTKTRLISMRLVALIEQASLVPRILRHRPADGGPRATPGAGAAPTTRCIRARVTARVTGHRSGVGRRMVTASSRTGDVSPVRPPLPSINDFPLAMGVGLTIINADCGA